MKIVFYSLFYYFVLTLIYSAKFLKKKGMVVDQYEEDMNELRNNSDIITYMEMLAFNIYNPIHKPDNFLNPFLYASFIPKVAFFLNNTNDYDEDKNYTDFFNHTKKKRNYLPKNISLDQLQISGFIKYFPSIEEFNSIDSQFLRGYKLCKIYFKHNPWLLKAESANNTTSDSKPEKRLYRKYSTDNTTNAKKSSNKTNTNITINIQHSINNITNITNTTQSNDENTNTTSQVNEMYNKDVTTGENDALKKSSKKNNTRYHSNKYGRIAIRNSRYCNSLMEKYNKLSKENNNENAERKNSITEEWKEGKGEAVRNDLSRLMSLYKNKYENEGQLFFRKLTQNLKIGNNTNNEDKVQCSIVGTLSRKILEPLSITILICKEKYLNKCKSKIIDDLTKISRNFSCKGFRTVANNLLAKNTRKLESITEDMLDITEAIEKTEIEKIGKLLASFFNKIIKN